MESLVENERRVGAFESGVARLRPLRRSSGPEPVERLRATTGKLLLRRLPPHATRGAPLECAGRVPQGTATALWGDGSRSARAGNAPGGLVPPPALSCPPPTWRYRRRNAPGGLVPPERTIGRLATRSTRRPPLPAWLAGPAAHPAEGEETASQPISSPGARRPTGRIAGRKPRLAHKITEKTLRGPAAPTWIAPLPEHPLQPHIAGNKANGNRSKR